MRWLAALFLIACHSSPAPPPVLGEFPHFALTDQAGHSVHLADLRGRPTVADFIFTRCPTICPRLTERMARLSNELKGVRFVSFSVDPDYDTPAVLTDYAAAHHAGWTFLTGPIDAVAAGAKLALERDPKNAATTGGILHGTHFLLIDGAGQIRGYYDSADDESLARLRADVTAVSK